MKRYILLILMSVHSFRILAMDLAKALEQQNRDVSLVHPTSNQKLDQRSKDSLPQQGFGHRIEKLLRNLVSGIKQPQAIVEKEQEHNNNDEDNDLL